MNRTWEPCTRPKHARKASGRNFDGLPWFACGEGYVMQIYRAAGRTYACITNKMLPKKVFNPETNRTWRIRLPHGLQPQEIQWYSVTEKASN